MPIEITDIFNDILSFIKFFIEKQCQFGQPSTVARKLVPELATKPGSNTIELAAL